MRRTYSVDHAVHARAGVVPEQNVSSVGRKGYYSGQLRVPLDARDPAIERAGRVGDPPTRTLS